MRSLLEGGRHGERSEELLLPGSRQGKHDRNQQCCFLQDFALIATVLSPHGTLTKIPALRLASRDERQSAGRLRAEGPGGVAHPVEGGGSYKDGPHPAFPSSLS